MEQLIELHELRIGNLLDFKGEVHYVSMLSMIHRNPWLVKPKDAQEIIVALRKVYLYLN